MACGIRGALCTHPTSHSHIIQALITKYYHKITALVYTWELYYMLCAICNMTPQTNPSLSWFFFQFLFLVKLFVAIHNILCIFFGGQCQRGECCPSCITVNVSHPLRNMLVRHRSRFGTRLIPPRCTTERNMKSFLPVAITLQLLSDTQHAQTNVFIIYLQPCRIISEH